MTPSTVPVRLHGWALILGASSGFGAATARALAGAGLDIFGVHLDRRATLPNAERVAAEVEALAGAARFFNVNAADPDQPRRGGGGHGQRRWPSAARPASCASCCTRWPSARSRPTSRTTPVEAVTASQMDMTLDVMAHSPRLLDAGRREPRPHGTGRAHLRDDVIGGSRRAAVLRPRSRRPRPRWSRTSGSSPWSWRRAASPPTAIRAGVTATPAAQKIPNYANLEREALRRNPAGRLTTTEDVARAIVVLSHPDIALDDGQRHRRRRRRRRRRVSYTQAIVLGLVQGLTEFLPVSSSGHLILVPHLFGWPDQGLAFDAALHLGTLAALVAYFRTELIGLLTGALSRSVIVVLAVGTVPAVLTGLAFGKAIEAGLRSPLLIAASTVFWAGVMWMADRRAAPPSADARAPRAGRLASRPDRRLRAGARADPGTSRSGITITTGLLSGLDRATAARFAFLLGIPVTAGPARSRPSSSCGRACRPARPGRCCSRSSSRSSAGGSPVWFLIRYLRQRSLAPFVIYRVLLTALILAVFLR